AMAWVSSAVPVGDEVYLYYAGYYWSHKYRRSQDRQIGLVRIKRDRYVARRAGPGGGLIAMPWAIIEGNRLTLNADAAGGEIRVQVCDAAGRPHPGLAFADCQPIAEDGLALEVRWKGSLAALSRQPVRLEFSLKNASLFAFEISSDAAPRKE
ncbi:MAG: hypothetical protein N3A66_09580, partial [Planctomycetota bacterium]|nr:hypothetical protein [Planctomycetota bacterium]